MSEQDFRPVVMVVRRSPDDSLVDVTLDLDGWITHGHADVVEGNVLAAACTATCQAVNGLLPGAADLAFVRCRRMEAEEESRPIVLSICRFSAGDGAPPQELLGAAFVRTDPLVAAVRATLDGLTRRLAPYVGQ